MSILSTIVGPPKSINRTGMTLQQIQGRIGEFDPMGSEEFRDTVGKSATATIKNDIGAKVAQKQLEVLSEATSENATAKAYLSEMASLASDTNTDNAETNREALKQLQKLIDIEEKLVEQGKSQLTKDDIEVLRAGGEITQNRLGGIEDTSQEAVKKAKAFSSTTYQFGKSYRKAREGGAGILGGLSAGVGGGLRSVAGLEEGESLTSKKAIGRLASGATAAGAHGLGVVMKSPALNMLGSYMNERRKRSIEVEQKAAEQAKAIKERGIGRIGESQIGAGSLIGKTEGAAGKTKDTAADDVAEMKAGAEERESDAQTSQIVSLLTNIDANVANILAGVELEVEANGEEQADRNAKKGKTEGEIESGVPAPPAAEEVLPAAATPAKEGLLSKLKTGLLSKVTGLTGGGGLAAAGLPLLAGALTATAGAGLGQMFMGEKGILKGGTGDNFLSQGAEKLGIGVDTSNAPIQGPDIKAQMQAAKQKLGVDKLPPDVAQKIAKGQPVNLDTVKAGGIPPPPVTPVKTTDQVKGSAKAGFETGAAAAVAEGKTAAEKAKIVAPVSVTTKAGGGEGQQGSPVSKDRGGNIGVLSTGDAAFVNVLFALYGR